MNSKFRGTLFGVLIGDSCGAIFEGEAFDAGQRLVLKRFLKNVETTKQCLPRLKYTDNTAMTKSVAACLINYNPQTYQKELAVNFVKEYFESPGRGYGSGVKQIFYQLKQSKFEDFLSPATYQFGGNGSFGNGAAMRISPVSLYCLNKSEHFLIDLVKKTSVVTHSNIIGVNGAILQALAVLQNLKKDSEQAIDPLNYIDELLEKFNSIETGADEHGIPEEKHFTKQLLAMKKLLAKKFAPSDEEVINILGHSVNALFSVPTAIYCFLKNSQSESSFKDTLEYAISLGGDTGTIAEMACALSGAHLGDAKLRSLVERCEEFEDLEKLSNDLHSESTKVFRDS